MAYPSANQFEDRQQCGRELAGMSRPIVVRPPLNSAGGPYNPQAPPVGPTWPRLAEPHEADFATVVGPSDLARTDRIVRLGGQEPRTIKEKETTMRRRRKVADWLLHPLPPGADERVPESPSNTIDFAKIVRDFRARSVKGGHPRLERHASTKSGEDEGTSPPSPGAGGQRPLPR